MFFNTHIVVYRKVVRFTETYNHWHEEKKLNIQKNISLDVLNTRKIINTNDLMCLIMVKVVK